MDPRYFQQNGVPYQGYYAPQPQNWAAAAMQWRQAQEQQQQQGLGSASMSGAPLPPAPHPLGQQSASGPHSYPSMQPPVYHEMPSTSVAIPPSMDAQAMRMMEVVEAARQAAKQEAEKQAVFQRCHEQLSSVVQNVAQAYQTVQQHAAQASASAAAELYAGAPDEAQGTGTYDSAAYTGGTSLDQGHHSATDSISGAKKSKLPAWLRAELQRSKEAKQKEVSAAPSQAIPVDGNADSATLFPTEVGRLVGPLESDPVWQAESGDASLYQIPEGESSGFAIGKATPHLSQPKKSSLKKKPAVAVEDPPLERKAPEERLGMSRWDSDGSESPPPVQKKRRVSPASPPRASFHNVMASLTDAEYVSVLKHVMGVLLNGSTESMAREIAVEAYKPRTQSVVSATVGLLAGYGSESDSGEPVVETTRFSPHPTELLPDIVAEDGSISTKVAADGSGRLNSDGTVHGSKISDVVLPPVENTLTAKTKVLVPSGDVDGTQRATTQMSRSGVSKTTAVVADHLKTERTGKESSSRDRDRKSRSRRRSRSPHDHSRRDRSRSRERHGSRRRESRQDGHRRRRSSSPRSHRR